MRHVLFLIIIVCSCLSPTQVRGLSFNLDSVAEWGRFPRFCVNTYRWGDRFFNTYDSAYVSGTGTKFNVKIVSDSYLNHLNFRIPSRQTIDLLSDPSTTMGVYLTYLAVSVGYDINVSKLFGRSGRSRQRYQFGFNCSLMSVEAFWERNTVGTKLRRFGNYNKLDLDFNGVALSSWGLEIYYFFNHKRYSQAAAYAYSKIQRRSQGSFYAGLSIINQNYDIDFSSLPQPMLDALPPEWGDYHYRVDTSTYGVRAGYGYNWSLPHGWTIGLSESPVVGFSRGTINSDDLKVRFSLYNHAKFSAVWNHQEWFIGMQGIIDSSIVNDRSTLFVGSNLNFNASFGYRFNLW